MQNEQGLQENNRFVYYHDKKEGKLEFSLEDFGKKHLETGRFHAQFESLGFIGKGGFGTVEKASHKLEETIYAIKKVRVHLSTEGDILKQIQNHRTYREVKALSTSN